MLRLFLFLLLTAPEVSAHPTSEHASGQVFPTAGGVDSAAGAPAPPPAKAVDPTLTPASSPSALPASEAAGSAVAPAIALPAFEAAVCCLCGASSLEELDQSVLENFETLASRPLLLNEASLSKLLASGLLSAYQCATLIDYRSRCGDILSFEELSRIDGFSPLLAQALRPFVRLDSVASPGRSSIGGDKRFHCEGALQGGWKGAGGGSGGNGAGSAGGGGVEWNGTASLAGKIRGSYAGFEAGVGSQAGVSVKWKAEEMHPFVSYEGRRWLRRAIIGDFHARFSQGLCRWSGFSLSGFSSPTSFVRRPTGVKPYSSWSRSSSLRGAALTMGWGRWEVSLLGNISGLIRTGRWDGSEDFAAASLSYLGRWGTLSLTASSLGLSSTTSSSSSPASANDSKGCLQPGGRISLGGHGGWKGVEVFGEVCVSFAGREAAAGGSGAAGSVAGAAASEGASLQVVTHWAAVLGASGTFGEGWRWSASGRWYDPDFNADLSGGVRSGSQCANEAGVAAGLHWESGRKWVVDGTLDACLHPRSRDRRYARTGQLKGVLNGSWKPASAWTVRSRAALRLRNYGEKCKVDWRAEGTWTPEVFHCVAAFQMCRCAGWGLLGALEQSLHFPWGTFYLEETLYSAPQWADRLYRYERDAPGSFSVPACYGKGYRLSLYVCAQPWRGIKCYALAAWRHFVYKGEQRRLPEFRLQRSFKL